jgi:hypothetical protein
VRIDEETPERETLRRFRESTGNRRQWIQIKSFKKSRPISWCSFTRVLQWKDERSELERRKYVKNEESNQTAQNEESSQPRRLFSRIR